MAADGLDTVGNDTDITLVPSSPPYSPAFKAADGLDTIAYYISYISS